MSPELQQAVKERVELGHTKEQITAELQEAGYDDATITSVYNATVSAEPISATELPSAIALFKQAWAFAISRPDLLVLLAVPTFLINGGTVAMQMGWISLGVVSMIGITLGFFAILFLQFLVQLTLAHTALKTHQVGVVPLSDSWDWATSNVWPWLWIAALSTCVVFGGFMLFIIPGVIVSFYIAFAMYAFIDEDARGMSALQRSRELVTGNFWNILSRFVVFILIILGFSILFGITAAILAGFLGSEVAGITQMTMSVFDAILTAFASLLGVYFAAGIYSALTAQPATPVEPSSAYPVLGWFGAVVLLALVALGGFGAAAYISENGLEGIDFQQMLNADADVQMMETRTELAPEQQAEFDAFMEEFGEQLDSF
jgi:hypothetical protein